MPPLSDTLRKDSPAGYAPTTASLPTPPPSPLTSQQGRFKSNTSIRTPLPPFNADLDNLHQFDDSNPNVPRRRVIPLPRTPAGSGTVTNITNTTVNSTSGSGVGGTTLTAKTVTITTLGGSQALPMQSKSFQLISVTATAACELRIYGSSLAMASDSGRAMDAPPPAEWANNIITDVVLDTAPYTWVWQNRVGCNTESPQNPQAYIAVTNLAGGPTAIQISLVFLPLESL